VRDGSATKPEKTDTTTKTTQTKTTTGIERVLNENEWDRR
jgi:hypothetical protein